MLCREVTAVCCRNYKEHRQALSSKCWVSWRHSRWYIC
jgi:hypothetical protein